MYLNNFGSTNLIYRLSEVTSNGILVMTPSSVSVPVISYHIQRVDLYLHILPSLFAQISPNRY